MPDRLDMPCAPAPNWSVSPEVIVEVVDPDDPLDAVTVRLIFGVALGSYGGDVLMRLDSARKAFVYRLPPVTRAAVDAQEISIGLTAIAQNPSSTIVPRPAPLQAIVLNRCLGTIGNG